MTQRQQADPVAQRHTGRQLLDLATTLAAQRQHTEAVSVVEQGLTTGALREQAVPVLLSVALKANTRDAFKAVDLLRTVMTQASTDGVETAPAALTGFCQALLRLAQLYATDPEVSRTLLAEAEALLASQTSVEAHYLSAVVKLGQGTLPQQLASSVKAALAGSGGTHGGAWLLLASLLSQQGERSKAISALKGGLSAAAPPWRSHLWLGRARLEAVAGDAAAALHCVQQAVAYADSPEASAESQAAMCEMHLAHNAPEAQQCLARLEALAAGGSRVAQTEAAALKAAMARRRGDAAAALAALSGALDSSWDNPRLLRAAGLVLADSSRSQHHQLLAYANLKRTTDAMPSDGEAWHVLGRVCSELGHDDEAAKCQVSALRASRFPAVVDFIGVPLDVVGAQ